MAMSIKTLTCEDLPPLCKHWLGTTHSRSSGSAKLKFRSTIATNSESEKTPNALIDTGATYHFCRQRSVFIVYKEMKSEDVKGATGLSKVVDKGLVKMPIGKDVRVVKAYHTPMFHSNILSVRCLGKSFDVMFSEYKYGIPCCALQDQNSVEALHKYPLKDGRYPISLNHSSIKTIVPKANTAVTNADPKSLEMWYLGHSHGSRIQQVRNSTLQYHMVHRR